MLLNHQQEGNSHVVIALVVVHGRLVHQHPHNQHSQLILEKRSPSLLNARRKSVQTPVDSQDD